MCPTPAKTWARFLTEAIGFDVSTGSRQPPIQQLLKRSSCKKPKTCTDDFRTSMGIFLLTKPSQHFCLDVEKISISKSHTVCDLVSNSVEEKPWAIWNQATDHAQPRGSHFSFINPLRDTNSIGDISACIEVPEWFPLHKLHRPHRCSHLHSNGRELRKQLNSKLPSSTRRDGLQTRHPHPLASPPSTHRGAARRTLIGLSVCSM